MFVLAHFCIQDKKWSQCPCSGVVTVNGAGWAGEVETRNPSHELLFCLAHRISPDLALNKCSVLPHLGHFNVNHL